MSAAGEQIGPYRLDREIGRGGMGVVYLATDTRLDRDVAIKALPPELAQDPERLARFEREARTLASLSHPNVAGIYGVEEQGGNKYLVLEYVEGETLAERLDRGALPIDEALEIAIKIAAGVEAAHEAGVIHRDLKPANVKITSEGEVKVLDFGLARVDEGATSSSSSGTLSESPTLTSPVQHSPTMPGAILGTAPYMSPEQARGRKVDRRTDVWSFGVTLYEMLTGSSPFLGETATDSIGAILHKDVDFDRLPGETPLRVRELLRRMLERDKAKRLRDLGDAMLELEAARLEPAEAEFGKRARRGGPGPLAMALGALVLAAVAGVGGWRASALRGAGVERASASAPAFSLLRATDQEWLERWPSLSQDGSRVVYESRSGGDGDIYSQRVGGFNAMNLTPNSDANETAPALSPDGELIAFQSDRAGGGIYIMGATGESPRRLTEFGFDPAWSPDGSKIVFATEGVFNPLSRFTFSELWVVEVETGETTRLYEGDAVHPSWSPSGERIAFWTYRDGGQRDLYTMRADGTDVAAVTEDAATDWNPVWSPDGKWLYFSSDRGGDFGIWRVAIDESSGNILGEPQRVATSAGATAGYLSFSKDGTRLGFMSSTMRFRLDRIDIDPETGSAGGDPRTLTLFTTGASAAAISPDGSLIAYQTVLERQGDLYVLAIESGERRQLTDDAAKDRGPKWIDGSRLLFYSDRDGEYRAWSIRVDGGGLELVAGAAGGFTDPVMAPDGSFVAGGGLGNEVEIISLGAEGEQGEPEPLPPHPRGLRATRVSDVGPASLRLLVTLADEGRAVSEFAVLSLETGEYTSIGSATEAKFYSDPRFVLLARGQELVRLDTQTGESIVVYREERGGDTLIGFDLAPDDSWVCIGIQRAEADLWVLEFEEASGGNASRDR